MNITTVFAIGRWMPIHLGHKEFLVKLARQFDRLIIGIGSCYENGTSRNCIPAVEREKLLRKILKTEGIDNAVIIPIEDRETFEEWIDDVCRVCQKYDVTHFCTGNKEDILDVLKMKGIDLNVEMINPEESSSFPFHATDIRNAILAGDIEKLDVMIPSEIKPMILDQISREIHRSSRGEGQAFIPGRQTVDIVLTVTDCSDGQNYVLMGKRSYDKIDFPGVWGIPGAGIREFETPIDAAIRCFADETGIELVLQDNADEPAMVTITTLHNKEAALHFIGIYASADESINGTRGGGSQCFAVHIDGDIKKIAKLFAPKKDMIELSFVDVDNIYEMTLAYDQKRMVFDALDHLYIPYDNGEDLAALSESGDFLSYGVKRAFAHKEGVLHAASHVYIYKFVDGELWFLLQRRSFSKDSFPGCLDMSSGGHVEKGCGFLDTAQKEVQEELGLEIPSEEFRPLFQQSIEYEAEFYGKPFIDREVNMIYAVHKDVDPSRLLLQKKEVAEMRWLSEREIRDMLVREESEICLNRSEFEQVVLFLKTE